MWAGIHVVKWLGLKIKFQFVSKTHLVQNMHNKNKKVSAYLRPTPVRSTDQEMLTHSNL
jgi:hypothetical protein